MNRRYVLISPCRDEATYMCRTLDAVAAQSIVPALWVVVDDGSTDDTPKILAEYAARLPYLRVVTRADRGKRAVGPGVIEAFYAGLDTVDLADFEYVCKLDLDLDFSPHYFQRLIERMEADPRLGTFSGKPWVEIEGQLVPEPAGDEMSVGMTKFFRCTCFGQIGGFVHEVMWDGIDCHRARLLGWKVGSSDVDPALRIHHLRPMGSSQVGIHVGRQRHGFGQWFMGTAPLYLIASSVFRMAHPPYISGGLSMLLGYVQSARKNAKRYGDARFRRFLRRYQWLMLTRGKRRATQRVEHEQRWAFDPQRAALPLGGAPPKPFPLRLSGAPLVGKADLPPLAATDATSSAETMALEQRAGRGGWAQVFNASALRRYCREPVYAQLVQPACLLLAATPGLLKALAARIPHAVCIAHGRTEASALAAAWPAGQALPLELPIWTWEARQAALEQADQALRSRSPTVVVCALESPQQEWLINALLPTSGATWWLGLGCAAGPR